MLWNQRRGKEETAGSVSEQLRTGMPSKICREPGSRAGAVAARFPPTHLLGKWLARSQSWAKSPVGEVTGLNVAGQYKRWPPSLPNLSFWVCGPALLLRLCIHMWEPSKVYGKECDKKSITGRSRGVVMSGNGRAGWAISRTNPGRADLDYKCHEIPSCGCSL
jgi:hypothetical protein